MTVADFLQRLQADTAVDGAPLNWSRIRDEIHAEHDRATTTHDRETLLGVHKTIMDHVEQHTRPKDLEAFKKFRREDYNLLLIKEGMIGNDTDNLSAHVMAAITNREVAAGRMSPDDELHKIAVAGSFVLGSRPKPYTLSDFSLKRLFSRSKEKAMSDKRCMYIVQKKAPGPVTRDECCEKTAVEQEADTGRWYCREHLDKRRSGDAGVSLSSDEILAYCRSRLPQSKVPESVLFVNELPKNSRGKIDRKALVDLWVERSSSSQI